MTSIRIVTGTTCPTVAENVALFLNAPLYRANVTSFSSGELLPVVEDHMRNQDITIIGTCNPDTKEIIPREVLLPYYDKYQENLKNIFTNTTDETLVYKSNLSMEKIEELLPKDTTKGLLDILNVFLVGDGRLNRDLNEICLLLDGIAGSSTAKMNLIMLALPFQRQDKKFEPHQPLSAAWVLKTLKTASRGKLDSFITFDPHTENLEGIASALDYKYFAALSFKNLVMQQFLNKYGTDLSNLMILPPDMGRYKMINSLAQDVFGEEYGKHILPIGKLRKRGNVDDIKIFHEFGPGSKRVTPSNRDILIFDDMIDSGGTIIKVVLKLQSLGREKPQSITVAAIHGYFTKNAKERMQAIEGINSFLVTNSLESAYDEKYSKLKTIDCSSFLSNIIERIHLNESLKDYYNFDKFKAATAMPPK